MSESALEPNQPKVATEVVDWSLITHDVLCPLCEYNLRGLPQPRCPECGYRFVWSEVLDPQLQDHPYLYEHNPSRPVYALFRTAFGACRTKRFWSRLHPSQRSRLAGLLIYWLFGSIFVIASSLIVLAVEGIVTAYCMSYQSLYFSGYWPDVVYLPSGNRIIFSWFSGVPGYLSAIVASFSAAMNGGYQRDVAIEMSIMGLWPWVVFLSLQVFQISMRRHRLRPTHMLRCAIYSTDLFSWAVVYGLFTTIGLLGLCWPGKVVAMNFNSEALIGIASIVWFLWGTWRLRQAVKHYLRFDWPLATALSAQIITALTILAGLQVFGFALM